MDTTERPPEGGGELVDRPWDISHSTRDATGPQPLLVGHDEDDEEEHDERQATSHRRLDNRRKVRARLRHAKARPSTEGTQGGKVLRKRGPILLRTDTEHSRGAG